MIDEDALRDLLAEAAAAAPAPGRAPDALLDALHAERPRTRSRRRPVLALAAAAAVVVAVVLGASALRDRPGEVSLAPERPATTVAPSMPTTTAAALDGRQRGILDGGAGAVAGGGTAAQPAPAPQTAQPADTARVIKTGSIDLEVRDGAFDGTVERITSLTTGLGGYVAESTTAESDDVPHGSITVRVPASSFEALLRELRGLGDVRSVTSKGTDVTAQFTDLAARLSALTATRDRLLEVLRGARNVGDIIAVQDRITGVQTEIEQVQGQQRLLTDQTSFGTLSVTLAEPGADEVRITAPEDDGGLGGAWREARRRFGDAVEGLIEWSGTAAVVLLVGLAVALLARIAWARGRRLLV